MTNYDDTTWNSKSPVPAWKPEILDLANNADRHRLRALEWQGIILDRHDTMPQQLRDLIAARHPGMPIDPQKLSRRCEAELGDTPAETWGRWVYFPWSRRLVHLLPEAEFRMLRSDRNRDKITRAEQAQLAGATIGVVGLSVGQASAVTLALEGVGRRFRLADFDDLALSNLNRLRAGCHELGLNKAVIAARQMFEIDPYLDIEIFPDGITDRNVGTFLGDGEDRLTVLVEECDDFYMKLYLREEARARGIPVVMDTNDRGLLDIERFDLDPARPPFHGLLAGLDAARLRGLTIVERIPHLKRIIGAEALSPRLASSMKDIGRTLSTWPQLASGVALGGALVADAVRRMLLGELNSSGRFYVDLETLVSDR